jgi:hypothetical protein
MPREIVGSQFENEDDERTWDELGIGRELAEDDDDYWDEDNTYRPKYSDAQVAAWTTYLRLRDADADRPPAPAGVFDPVADEFQRLSKHLHGGDWRDWGEAPDPDWSWWWGDAFGSGFPPDGFQPAPEPTPTAQTPTLDDTVRDRLDDEQRRHFDWLLEGRRQADIARDLGISQQAVHKREQKLRATVDTIAVEATGQPYVWLPQSQPKGGRPRRR